MTAFFTCPSCSEEHEVDVDLGEHFADIPTYCEHCHGEFTEAEQEQFHSKALEDAQGAAIDRATDIMGGDR